MIRTLSLVAAAMLALPTLLLAEEVKGKVKSVDAEKSTITITVDDKDQTLDVSKDVKVTHLVGKKEKKAESQDLPGGLGALTAGTAVTMTTEKKDDKDVVTAIKVDGLAKKKK